MSFYLIILNFVIFFYRIYPIELEIKDITYADRYTSYLDIDLAIDNEGRIGQIPTT
jgi:hypothetical protein